MEKHKQRVAYLQEGELLFDCPDIALTDIHDDNDMLIFYQFEYLIKNKNSALTKMYPIMLKIAEKTIAKMRTQNPHIAKMTTDEIKDAAHDAVTVLLMRYKNPHYFVRKNFIAQVYYAVIFVLFRQRRQKEVIIEIDDVNCTM